MTTVVFEHDPWRGGFLLRLDPSRRPTKELFVFHGTMSVWLDREERIIGVESFFGDHGGLPLRGIQGSTKYPEGEFRISGANLRVGPMQLRQDESSLELWFSTGHDLPRDHWISLVEEKTGLCAWFSRQKARGGWPVPGKGGWVPVSLVAGLRVPFDRTPIAFPVTALRVSAEDFK